MPPRLSPRAITTTATTATGRMAATSAVTSPRARTLIHQLSAGVDGLVWAPLRSRPNGATWLERASSPTTSGAPA